MHDLYIFLLLGALLLALAAFLIYLRISMARISLTRRMLDQSLREKKELENFINLFTNKLKVAKNVTETLDDVAHNVTEYVNCRAACIFEIRDDGFLHPVGVSGNFPPLQKSHSHSLTKPKYMAESLKNEKIRIGEGVVGQVASTGVNADLPNPSLDPFISEAVKSTRIELDSLVAVALKDEGRIMGVVCVINSRYNAPFSKKQIQGLEFMRSPILVAMNLVKVYADISTRQRLDQELKFTKQLQASLLPKNFPEWPPFAIRAHTQSAKEVSGDFYDFVHIDDDRIMIVVGDASGKGIPACMVMSMARSFIRASLERFTSISEMLVELNSNLYRDTDEGRFATISCCLLNKKERTVEFARAGHTEMLVHQGKGKISSVSPEGPAVGLMPSELANEFDTFSFVFSEGMSLLIYSDGITEAINPEGKEFGFKRLEEIFKNSCVAKASPERCVDSILRALDDFSKGTPQFDDQTMVIISFDDSPAL